MMTDQKQRQREAGVARTLSFSSQTELQRVIQTDCHGVVTGVDTKRADVAAYAFAGCTIADFGVESANIWPRTVNVLHRKCWGVDYSAGMSQNP
jgi:hypothetical protein